MGNVWSWLAKKLSNEDYRALYEQSQANLARALSKEKETSITNTTTTTRNQSTIDRLRIELYVDQMLKNPNINISWIPDSAEKRIYVNTLVLLLQLLGEGLETAQIDFLFHRLKAHLEPIAVISETKTQ